MTMSLKIKELGLFWLKDNMQQAQNALLRTKDARKKTASSDYSRQMDTLIAAQQEVLSVWERHVALEQLEEDRRKNPPTQG